MEHLVVSVHGINTFGQWQERLEKELKTAAVDNCVELDIRNYHYGVFSIIAFFIPFLRWLVVRQFRKYLVAAAKEKQWERIDLVGHSFGTHIIGWALFGIPESVRPTIHTVILAGSVLKSNIPWQTLLGRKRGRVHRVVNDCGISDAVLILNQLFVLFTGMAGRIGFNGGTGSDFRNRYFAFGHSGYFMKCKDLDNRFMKEYWLPLLLTDTDITMVDHRKPTFLSALQVSILNNAEPIKLGIYVSPVIAAVLWISGLYKDASSQRNDALRRESLFLSERADQEEASGDNATAALVALE